MPKKSEWPNGTEIQKTAMGLPRRVWEAAKTQAMRENRTLQELAATALAAYVRGSEMRMKISKRGDSYRVRFIVDQAHAPFLTLPTTSEVATLLGLLQVPAGEIERALAELRAKGSANVPEILE